MHLDASQPIWDPPISVPSDLLVSRGRCARNTVLAHYSLIVAKWLLAMDRVVVSGNRREECDVSG